MRNDKIYSSCDNPKFILVKLTKAVGGRGRSLANCLWHALSCWIYHKPDVKDEYKICQVPATVELRDSVSLGVVRHKLKRHVV